MFDNPAHPGDRRDKDHDRSCIFCRPTDPAVNRVIASHDTMYARWDNFPSRPGHLEIVPFRHIGSFFDMTDQETQDLHVLARSMRAQLDALLHPDGFTIGVNDGTAAGRTIAHLHLHIIPRHHGDLVDPRGGIRRIFPDCNPDIWA